MKIHSNEIQETRKRLIISCVIALSIFGGIFSQLISIPWIPGNLNNAFNGNEDNKLRKSILDRNGDLLATSINAWKISINPKEVIDPMTSAKILYKIMPEKNYDWILDKLTSKSGYEELDRKASPKRYKEILNSGITGIHFKKNETRFYPTINSASHIIGHVDRENIGRSGIEGGQDNKLRFGHKDIKLTIDLGIQHIIESELQNQIDEFDAIGGVGILININNGEIIGLASNPTFDLNNNIHIEDQRFNKSTHGTYEMGSVFKLINTAIALDTQKVNIQDKFDISEPLKIGKHLINDFHSIKKFNGPVNVPQILIHSSNIGSAKIAEKIGPKLQREYMEKIGLTSKPNLPLPEISKPQVNKKWNNLTAMTIGYGHGISVSPLQLTFAIAAIMNGGNYVNPKLVKDNKPIISTKVFNKETSLTMRKLARMVVTNGSGSKADAKGYIVGGKTGTAEKLVSGQYSKKKNLASFIGIFPMHNPQYLILLMIDEPKGKKSSNFFSTGGWVAAPAVKEIITQSAPILKITPIDQNLPEIKHILDFRLNDNLFEAKV